MRVVLLIINVVFYPLKQTFYCKLTLYQENNTKNVELCLDLTSKPKLSLDFISRQITLQEYRWIWVFLQFEAHVPEGDF